jgi:hypothetical protein
MEGEELQQRDPGQGVIEDKWSDLFAGSASATGEEELLRIASKYSFQISARQIKALLYLEHLAYGLPEPFRGQLTTLVVRWLELKENNNSDIFVMKALEYISLRKFFNENSFKVDIQK